MFDVQKATQIAAYFIWKRGGQMSFLKLMRLMYLSEREFLVRYGERLTGDRMVSMKHGPVLSEIYDLFKISCQSPEWNDWIAGESIFELSFKKMDQINPSDTLELFDCLSEAEKQLLDEIYSKYGNWTRWKICDLTHTKDCCPEWTDPNGSELPISLQSILIAHGKSKEDSEKIVEHIREMDEVEETMRTFA